MKDLEPQIVAFCCHNSIGQETASSLEREKGVDIRIVKLPCSGKIEVLHILKVFETGVDGVLVAGCLEGECRFLDGNLRARGRVNHAKKLLRQLGIEPERLCMVHLSPEMRLEESAGEAIGKIKELGATRFKA